MKINLQTRVNWCKIMKITFGQLLIALTFTGISYAANTKAQTVLDRPVDLSVNDISLEKVLQKLEESADTKFIYSSNIINASQKVSIDAKGETLKLVLDELLKPKKISYRLINNCIVLSYDIMVNPGLKEIAAERIIPKSIVANIVQGAVTDEAGDPLVGVTVQIKGTGRGAVTDVDGHYSLNVPGTNDTLLFTYVGYVSREEAVNGRLVINVKLQASAHSLNDVVVVGYGTQKRKDLTGSISTIRAEDISRANPVSPFEALQGQAAGVNIAKTSGLPGTDFEIDIRGLGSINYDNSPLVVIDGNMGGDLNTLNPSDIASIDILKDASATAIYGSRGANGVVIVTTKQGIEGTIKINYDAYVGVRAPAHLPTMQNAKQWVEINQVVRGGLTSSEKALLEAGKSTDWIALVTRPGLQTSHVISVSGGTKSTNYYFSGGYLNQDGLLDGINYKRYTLNGSINSQLNKLIKVGFNTNYSYGIQNTGSLEMARSAYRARPTATPYYDDLVNPSESSDVDFHGYAVWMGVNDHQVLNPLVEGYPGNGLLENKVSRFSARGYVEVTPVKGLSLKSSLSTHVFETGTGDYRGTFTKSNKGSNKPTASHDTKSRASYTLDNLLTYKLEVAKHHFTLTALQSAFSRRDESYGISVKDLPYQSDWYNLGSAGTISSIESDLVERTLLSYMGRLNYGYDGKYLLTLTGRWDGASQLAKGHQWGFFPSAGFAWRLINEPFIENMKIFSDLKLRLTYGLVGNNVVPPYGTQASLLNTAYDFDGSSAFGFAPAAIANHELGWEKSREADLGLNVGFLKNRITADIDLYRRNTLDLIVKQKLPTSTGFGSVTTNVGKVLNQGLEVSLNTVNVTKKDFSWRTSINFSTNHNEILELYGGDITEDIGNSLFVGQSLRANYDYQFAGVWQLRDSTAAMVYKQTPGQVRVIDQNDDNKIQADSDRVVIGSGLPRWMLGISNKFSYKNWDLSFMIYTRQGVQYRNAMLAGTMGQIGHGRYNALALNYWTRDNPTNDYYSPLNPGPYSGAIFYQDATYWRISDITLGYRLSKQTLKRLKLNSLRIYGQVKNPFVFTDYISFDPEYNSSTYKDDVPSVTYTLGVSVSF